jgi:hypothetical protein
MRVLAGIAVTGPGGRQRQRGLAGTSDTWFH